MDYRRLKEIIKQRGMTLEDLSFISKVPLSTLSKIASGATSNPGIDTMEAICRALRCSLDEFSLNKPVFPYEYEEYLYRAQQLSPSIRNYIAFIIDTEFDRMVYVRTNKKMVLRCLTFPNIIGHAAQYDSRIIRELMLDRNELTEQCTFGIYLHGPFLEPAFFRGSLLGFQYRDDYEPKRGEIWLLLRNGLLYIGRYANYAGKRVFRSLLDETHDIDLLGDEESKFRRIGRFVGVIQSDFDGLESLEKNTGW